MSPQFWRGRRGLLTGHTGFKGAWLALWLARMGAEVTGLALPPASTPNLYELAGLDQRIRGVIGDINDRAVVERAMAQTRPEVVFHLAAQALVRESYRNPVDTFSTNVTGLATVLDVVRHVPQVAAVVVVTSDKCYENNEWVWGYREIDHLGGRDPYSASKGCAEIVARAMQRSFFAPYAASGHPGRIATVRAGNVIGGGDWSSDRLVPDIVRGCLGKDGEVRLRSPSAVRPWQHVLEPLGAYLMIAERLVIAPEGADDRWNIGPSLEDDRAVLDVAKAMVASLGVGRVVIEEDRANPHEARLLRLDCSKAKALLGWQPMLRFEDSVRLTAEWYSAWRRGEDMLAFTEQQIDLYVEQQSASVGASTQGAEHRRSPQDVDPGRMRSPSGT
jgi:CDP-glucose 4,6-dehydratase